jgi:dTDP-glucose 4,6-dehydratase
MIGTMRILVTGGAGFIGSAFVRRRLAATDDSIVVLDLLTYAGSLASLASVQGDARYVERLDFVRGDICDARLVSEVVGDADAIVNFAAETHVDRSILDADAFLRTGILGLHVLLEEARRRAADGGRMRLVQVSTDEVYGSVESGHMTETDALAPRSPYAAAKAAGDLLCAAYHETHGTDIVVTRGANTYGPYQHPEKLIPLFVTNALDDRPLPLYGDGRQRRDWLFVDDHADAVGVALDRAPTGTILNIPAGEERANRDVAETLLDMLGKPLSLLRTVADRPGHDRRYAMDGSRIAALGWGPTVSFKDGLKATVDWYRANRSWWEVMRGADWDKWYERQYASRLEQSSPA